MKLELSVNCDTVEDILRARYNLTEDVRLTDMEFDEAGDLCAFSFEGDAADSKLICREWDDYAFVEGLIENAI